MKLEATTIPAGAITAAQAADMLRLMQTHYEGVSEDQFVSDLRQKDWVILLHEAGCLRGFSTQVLFEHEMEGRAQNVLFSGDTIIEKSHWGSLALPIAWGRLMNTLLAANPTKELYWLLTTKGYKTYRFLPVFFREYYPCHGIDTPSFEKALLNGLATRRFGARFNASSGILHSSAEAQRLREGIAAVDEKRLRDPHVAFFQQQNPGHSRGDELVCLARWHADNLTPYILRQI